MNIDQRREKMVNILDENKVDLEIKLTEGKIMHICEVVHSLEERIDNYSKLLGFRPWYIRDFWNGGIYKETII